MLKAQIGIDGTGRRKSFWVRLHLGRPWQGPFASCGALADALQRIAAHYVTPDTLEDIIEAFPRGGATRNYVIVPGPHDHPPGRGFQKALGFRRPRRSPEERKNLATLLKALGASGRVNRRRSGRSQVLSILNTRRPTGTLKVDGHFAGCQLHQISTRRAKKAADFCGDFTDADWYGSVFESAIFSGRGRRGKFLECKFKDAVLTGDLAESILCGSIFDDCLIGALLDGADLRDAVMVDCAVSAGASARGADLRGAILWFRHVDQIRGARVLLDDLIAVRHGTIELFGEPCVLFKPVQVVPGIRILNDAGERLPQTSRPPAEFFDSLLRCEGPVTNDVDELFLWDLAGSGFTGVSGDPVESCTLRLHAPRCLFRELPEIATLRLVGVFDQSCFERCIVRELVISFGSFRRLDLNSVWVDSLTIIMANTEVTGLRLPAREDVTIRFVWYGHDVPPVCHPYLHSCSLPVGLAQVVLDVWPNPDGCDWLARQLLRPQASAKRDSKYPTDLADRALASSAQTGEDVSQAATSSGASEPSLFTGELVTAFHLVAQRNRLRACVAQPGGPGAEGSLGQTKSPQVEEEVQDEAAAPSVRPFP